MTAPAAPPTAEDVRTEPQDALRMYVESEGFRIHVAHVREQWGNAAVMRRIKLALEEHPASEHSVLTQTILKMADEIRAIFAWPEEEYERLRTRSAQPTPAEDRFRQYRRTL